MLYIRSFSLLCDRTWGAFLLPTAVAVLTYTSDCSNPEGVEQKEGFRNKSRSLREGMQCRRERAASGAPPPRPNTGRKSKSKRTDRNLFMMLGCLHNFWCCFNHPTSSWIGHKARRIAVLLLAALAASRQSRLWIACSCVLLVNDNGTPWRESFLSPLIHSLLGDVPHQQPSDVYHLAGRLRLAREGRRIEGRRADFHSPRRTASMDFERVRYELYRTHLPGELEERRG